MLYKVTGGQDGISGIEVAGRRFEAGETVELPGTKAEWLVDMGYLEPVEAKSKKGTKTDPEPEPETITGEDE